MRVYTTKHSIVKLKHFQYCKPNYNRLLDLQQVVPNLPLEIETDSVGRKFVPICELDLEKFSSILALNPCDAAFVK